MDITYEQLLQEIANMVVQTNARTLLWERIPGKTCYYRVRGMCPPIVVSCSELNGNIQISNKRANVDFEDILELCHAIAQQIKRETTHVSEVTELLHAMVPRQEAG
jgi:hypothetical protein